MIRLTYAEAKAQHDLRGNKALNQKVKLKTHNMHEWELQIIATSWFLFLSKIYQQTDYSTKCIIQLISRYKWNKHQASEEDRLLQWYELAWNDLPTISVLLLLLARNIVFHLWIVMQIMRKGESCGTDWYDNSYNSKDLLFHWVATVRIYGSQLLK